jgi:hypothetical protein
MTEVTAMIARTLLVLFLLIAACVRSDRGDQCTRDPAALDRVERAPTACEADADCPCGSRCEGRVCTYDCRLDRSDMQCGGETTCTTTGACEGPPRQTP